MIEPHFFFIYKLMCPNIIFSVKDTEGIMSKKMEEIAYQASDKVYLKDDNGPYESLK